ncbi:MAG: hemin uptake protein HemP [Nitrosomonas sp.]|uniref:hemin uptake protein HemP n=1 Tax=Nitrosomonas sp. TaxID=42353 RepID=UPI0011D4CB35|nr:hemin uptake protein HemP [Nitrosomonas sp.]MBL8499711.1 hemin uptake protein HemP [Nitrosomonas sp.]MCG7756212.1 hemin uptake protein HemP [Nitrosomonas sp.]TXI37514.1 MAG: hemin uptake protein HemP [Nitrosomonas sp.]UJO99001.1 MAG: hemin uptake protein HemP [Nitrosomonas sp.]UJP02347.1 MAG: hemin uptake protein HemP [Nitrosomonas sp.]
MNTTNPSQTIIRNSPKSDLLNLSTLINSDVLFKNGDVVLILHKGEQYSLRRTRNGKLILNK